MDKKTLVLGLTGSIGMGKSTVAAQLKSLGAKICSADAIVHQLLGDGGAAVELVSEGFPGVVKNGTVDRKVLGEIVFRDKGKLAALEKILHPLVVEAENRFIAERKMEGTDIAVLEIPLLFETEAESRCDAVIVATAPPFIQRKRVMARPGMTPEKFRQILESQMPDAEKRRRADYVVQTGLGLSYSMRQIKNILKTLHAA